MEDEEALLTSTANPDTQIEFEDEIQDWRNLTKIKDTSLPKRGEKDYEPDGTNLQNSVLEESRNSMFDALAGDRSHVVKQHVKAIWISSQKRGLITKPKGSFLQTCGVIDSENKCWLRPEEFCYLAERGSIEPWFEDKDLAMSIEACYAYCFDNDDEIDEYHVYSYLKRHGFIVMKNEEQRIIPKLQTISPMKRVYSQLLKWINYFTLPNLITNLFGHKPYPFFQNLNFTSKKFTSYSQIYNSIKLIPFRSHSTPSTQPQPQSSSTQSKLIPTFNIWKPSPNFSKKSPPLPNFQILVQNVNKYKLPTLKQLHDLINSTNYQNKHHIDSDQSKRLKNGYGFVLIATVDYGIINIVKLSEADFGNENVWYVPGPKPQNKKNNGKNNKNQNNNNNNNNKDKNKDKKGKK
ncbi:putative tRNA-splicing endonuclease subunit [Wickerhamomyces ciferrii]|uniref:tRNA-splicing endonuclease subunit n=1 Tax=Wickerhamomyces ciferrii (strain ATCC 14091 / BCRC 22168 / CBS 111 / JCM 3599 / NBRC 0793 / NRRL Y-1031 F-60-10) TaxID=1206466 RepID=K0KM78_WICCF|nr:putative tRNA-splicing endonuclease subunit [Wickerhamomyces ciferrii]CCH43287.1 putative tRNA-splicing endonuclease subunit [Wickerhamomyces ciferrii]